MMDHGQILLGLCLDELFGDGRSVAICLGEVGHFDVTYPLHVIKGDWLENHENLQMLSNKTSISRGFP